MFSHHGTVALCTTWTVQSLQGVVVLVVTVFISVPLMIFHDHRKAEVCGWYELIQPTAFPWTSLSSCQYPASLSRLSRNPQKRLLFCEALCPMLSSPNNADVVFTCRVWGFFSLLHKTHDRQLWLSGTSSRLCFCTADDVVVRDFL